jgi:hypothetical protein
MDGVVTSLTMLAFAMMAAIRHRANPRRQKPWERPTHRHAVVDPLVNPGRPTHRHQT